MLSYFRHLFDIHVNCKWLLDEFHSPEKRINNAFKFNQQSFQVSPERNFFGDSVTVWIYWHREIVELLWSRTIWPPELNWWSWLLEPLWQLATWGFVNRVCCTPCPFSLLTAPLKQGWGGHDIFTKGPTYVRRSWCWWKAEIGRHSHLMYQSLCDSIFHFWHKQRVTCFYLCCCDMYMCWTFQVLPWYVEVNQAYCETCNWVSVSSS